MEPRARWQHSAGTAAKGAWWLLLGVLLGSIGATTIWRLILAVCLVIVGVSWVLFSRWEKDNPRPSNPALQQLIEGQNRLIKGLLPHVQTQTKTVTFGATIAPPKGYPNWTARHFTHEDISEEYLRESGIPLAIQSEGGEKLVGVTAIVSKNGKRVGQADLRKKGLGFYAAQPRAIFVYTYPKDFGSEALPLPLPDGDYEVFWYVPRGAGQETMGYDKFTVSGRVIE